MRLLICLDEKIIDVLNDYDGPPEYDYALQTLIERNHTEYSGLTHQGNLVYIPDEKWENPEVRKEVMDKVQDGLITQPGTGTGLGTETYTLMETFKEDAQICFNQHLRNPACNDYKSPSKKIIPNTNAERKAEGMGKLQIDNPNNFRYLCEYCPVHSLVVESARRKRGLYE